MRGNHFLHDLRRSGGDGQRAGIAAETANPMIVQVTRAAVQLQALLDNPLRGLVSEELDHTDLFRDIIFRDPRGKRSIVELSGRFQVCGHVGELVTIGLERGRGFAEGPPLLGICERFLQGGRRPGDTRELAERIQLRLRRVIPLVAALRPARCCARDLAPGSHDGPVRGGRGGETCRRVPSERRFAADVAQRKYALRHGTAHERG